MQTSEFHEGIDYDPPREYGPIFAGLAVAMIAVILYSIVSALLGWAAMWTATWLLYVSFTGALGYALGHVAYMMAQALSFFTPR